LGASFQFRQTAVDKIISDVAGSILRPGALAGGGGERDGLFGGLQLG
jgi:hypothetical protein